MLYSSTLLNSTASKFYYLHIHLILSTLNSSVTGAIVYLPNSHPVLIPLQSHQPGASGEADTDFNLISNWGKRMGLEVKANHALLSPSLIGLGMDMWHNFGQLDKKINLLMDTSEFFMLIKKKKPKNQN